MFGSATFTTVASSTTMSCATQITARASPPLRVACEGECVSHRVVSVSVVEMGRAGRPSTGSSTLPTTCSA